ncbi:MAG: DPP IV N-terminal domain-containing protein [Armatimonadota bacterium]|nr:DPP IV N-terminal domain-containing protein [Armatimonadota bacterium]
MKKTISRRSFLRQAALTGGAALLGAAAHSAPAWKEDHALPKPYRPTQAVLRKNLRQQEAYEAVVRQPVYKASLDPHWFHQNTRFWYRNDGPGGTTEFILVDAERGVRQAAFDHKKLAAGLAKASGRTVDAEALPFDTIAYTEDGKAVQFRTADESEWQCDLSSYVCAKVTKTAPTAEEKKPDESPTGQGDADGSLTSPDGRWTAFVKADDVWVRDNGSGLETRLSQNGASALPFGAMRWSPDGKMLAAFRIDRAIIKPVYLIESSPHDGGTRGVLHSHEYAQPGDKNTTYELWLFDPQAKTATQAQIERIDFGDAPELHWSADGRRFLFEKTERGHQRFRMLSVDARTGETQAVVDERAKTFINTSNSYTYYTEGAQEVIYVSEQDGWRHLYLYDGVKGGLKNQITRGEWVVRAVDKVEEDKRQIWFRASGKNPGQDPYLIHFYRVNFDGTGLTALTEGNGDHALQFSPDRKFAVDTYSRADLPPVHELRRVSDGGLVCPLETADISALTAGGWQPPEVFHAKGRDGQTDIWGLVFRPSYLDPTQKYPIIENIYAGPQDSFTRKTFAVRDAMQSLAELGFIVVQCDGMGTRNRSKAFHDVCWRNLKDAGLPDRIAWMQALARKHPYCDTDRVGIYGTSAGGQNSTGALLFHPEFYKVAVSSCGCHDNRIDKQWWNEQWMGYPVGPWYADSSNITHAENLRGKLLLFVGELDTNVPPESTVRLTDALMKAGKDFDFLIITGSDHTSGGAYGERRRRDYFVRHLLGVEPPDRNLPLPPVAPVLLAPHSPREERTIHPGGGEETSILFRNRAAHAVRLFWLPGDGTRKDYGVLNAGETRDIHTYADHAWLVVGADGNALALFIGEPKPGIAEIRPAPKR